MDNGAFKLLESATHRTLHAHNFARSSSQASLVLTDLLSRYLSLILATCSKYAGQAGRSNLTASDALSALQELGMSLDDLVDYCSSEGRELNRYAAKTARRAEDLAEFRAALANGLREDRDDAIPLFYGQVPDNTQEDDEENSSEAEEVGVSMAEPSSDLNGIATFDGMDVDERPGPSARTPQRSRTPPLPLSPISNPSSPSRKRPRTSSWSSTHPHIPSFLPPLPSVLPESTPLARSPSPTLGLPPASQPPPPHVEKPPNASMLSSVTPLQHSTATSASDYQTPIPYSQSTLSSVPEWHLPSALPPRAPPLANRASALPTPRTQPALIGAYHHILTHPPPKDVVPAAHPARHRVALALMAAAEHTPRWEPPDSVFGSSAPPMPRWSGIAPTHVVPVGVAPQSATGPDASGKERLLPQVPHRALANGERLAPSITQQGSRIPDLAKQILPPPMHRRTTRLGHPPVLMRGSQKLLYGPPVNAPWNSSIQPSAATPVGVSGPTLANGKVNGKDDPGAKGKDGKDVAGAGKIPDARLYATWDYEQKHFWEPLALGRGLKAKGAQVQLRDTPAGTGSDVNRRPSGLTIQVGRRDSIASRRDSMHSAG